MASRSVDSRAIENSPVLFEGGYADQPFVVRYPDGDWLCVATVSDKAEGDRSQRIVGTRSADRGASWSVPTRIEPDRERAASWGLPYLTSYGRVYVFYTFNTEGLPEVPTESGPSARVDTLGDCVYRFSDDKGETWSERHTVPVRAFEVDLANDFHGSVRYWWGVGKPTLIGGSVYIGATKVGKFGDPHLIFQMNTEGFVLRSSNLDLERDPHALRWETLPEGTQGIKVPAGVISEEHKVFGEGPHLYCTFRTHVGFVAQGRSTDGGLAWSTDSARYAANGQPLKNPRAATFAWNCGDGKYLLWFHNNSHTTTGQAFRNPAWLAAGREEGGVVRWSQPEIALYSEDEARGISYPDLILDGGQYFLTETNKTTARTHRLSEAVLDGLWNQGTVAELPDARMELAASAPAAHANPFSSRSGYSIEMWLGADALASGSRLWEQRGLRVSVATGGRLFIALDGRFDWLSDQIELSPDSDLAHVVIIVDLRARVLMVLADGVLQDGGPERPQGWGRIPAHANESLPEGIPLVPAATRRGGTWRAYDRPLRVSEAISSFLAGPGTGG
jgi:hypothetical protein